MKKLQQLFQLQTTILLNHVFSGLLKLFIDPKENKIYLYSTIIPIKPLSRKELAKMGKSIPNLLRYEVWATKSNSKLTFTLKHTSLSDIAIYNVELLKNPPTLNFLKNVAMVIVSKYRPLPTKVDKEFSALSKKYFNYLNYNQAQRRWNNGVIKKEKIRPDVQKMNICDIESCYDDFMNDLSALQLKYRAFTKILIDIYQNKGETHYLSKDNNLEIISSFSKKYGLSIFMSFFSENKKNNSLINLSDFHPSTKFPNERLTNTIISCVHPALQKLYN